MKRLYQIILALVFCTNTCLTAQVNECNLTKSSYSELQTVVPDDIRCLARNSENDITILFTFDSSCAPCRKHLPDAIQLVKEQNANFYLLFIRRESEVEDIERTIAVAQKIAGETELKMLIISDSLYSEKYRYKKQKKFQIISLVRLIQEKYENFLTEITPPAFENIAGLSKYIVLNKDGDVIFVSNYKDAEGYSDDDSKTQEKIIRAINVDRNFKE